MPATLTTVAGILKEVYEGDVTDQLQEDAVAMKRIQSNSEGVFEDAGGKFVRFPIRTQRNHGISYRGEGIQLANSGQQAYLQAQESLKYGYGRVRFTGQVMGLANSNPKAFVNAMDQEISGLKSDVARDNNRIAWGSSSGFANTGLTGIITTLTGTNTSTTCNAPLNNQVEVGMALDQILAGAGTVVVAGGSVGFVVLSVASNELSFVVDISQTFVTGNHVARTGNIGQEPFGLTALCTNTGTLHGINSATAGNETWKASRDDSTSTTLNEALMITACDDMRRKGGDKPTVVFCSLGVRRAYFNQLTSLRRYNEVKSWEGGLVGLSFNYGTEIPVVEDLDCPTSSMYFVNEKQMTVYSNQDWHFDDSDGNLLKWVPNFDAYEAYFKRYWQLVIHKRNASARFTALTEA